MQVNKKLPYFPFDVMEIVTISREKKKTKQTKTDLNNLCD